MQPFFENRVWLLESARNQYLLDGCVRKIENLVRKVRPPDTHEEPRKLVAFALREFLQNSLDHSLRSFAVGTQCVWTSQPDRLLSRNAVHRLHFGVEDAVGARHTVV